jgi:hypothetical protein
LRLDAAGVVLVQGTTSSGVGFKAGIAWPSVMIGESFWPGRFECRLMLARVRADARD